MKPLSKLPNRLQTWIFKSSPNNNKLRDHSPLCCRYYQLCIDLETKFIGLRVLMSSSIWKENYKRYFDNLWAKTRAKNILWRDCSELLFLLTLTFYINTFCQKTLLDENHCFVRLSHLYFFWSARSHFLNMCSICVFIENVK